MDLFDPWGVFALGAGSGAAICALAFLLVLNFRLPPARLRSGQVEDCSRLSGFGKVARGEEEVRRPGAD